MTIMIWLLALLAGFAGNIVMLLALRAFQTRLETSTVPPRRFLKPWRVALLYMVAASGTVGAALTGFFAALGQTAWTLPTDRLVAEHLTGALIFDAPVIAIALVTLMRAGRIWKQTRNGRKQKRLDRTIRRAYPTAIVGAVDGDTIKVVGRLWFAQLPLRAPLTGRRCACWQVEVVIRDIVESRYADLVFPVCSAGEGQDFFVEDRTGEAFVRCDSPRLQLVKDVRLTPEELDLEDPALRAFLRDLELDPDNLSAALQLREGVVKEGDEVAVLGQGRWLPDPETVEAGSTYRNAPTRLELALSPEGDLICSDDPFSRA